MAQPKFCFFLREIKTNLNSQKKKKKKGRKEDDGKIEEKKKDKKVWIKTQNEGPKKGVWDSWIYMNTKNIPPLL